MSKIFQIGVVGLGDISAVYLDNLKKYDNVALLACASRGLDKAQTIADAHEIPCAYKDVDALIADPDIDIILNLTVPEVHGAINLAALRAGKHVYSEKPLAATLAEATEIMDEAERRGLYVGCAPDTFLGGRLQACRELIDNDSIGRVIGAGAYVVSHGHEWHHPNPDFFYQPGAGPLLDIGPYYMTALLALLGPVKRCSAMSSRAFDKRTIETLPRRGEEIPVDVDTHIMANMEFENGALVNLLASFDVWDSELPRIEIYGTKGTICIRDVDPISGPNLFGGEIWLRTKENYRWVTNPRPATLSDWTIVEHNHPFNETGHDINSRGIGLVDMALAIRDGRPARASGAMAYHSLEVMECILKSAKENRYYEPQSRFELPAPLPINFPQES